MGDLIQDRDCGDENDARIVVHAQGAPLCPGWARGATFIHQGQEYRCCGCEATADGWVWRCPEHQPEGA